MTPFVAVPHAQAPVQTSALPSLPMAPQAVASVTLQAAPPTVANPEIYNNSRGTGSTSAPNSTATSNASVDSSVFFSLSARGGNILTRGFSSMFMAQMLGQGSGANQHTLQFFEAASRSLTLDNDTLESFATTRYMPSKASRPVDPSPAQQFQMARPAVPQRPAALTTQPVPAPMSPTIAQSFPTTSLAAKAPASPSLPTTPITPRVDIRPPSNFLTNRGVDAYLATLSRNAEAINDNSATIQRVEEIR